MVLAVLWTVTGAAYGCVLPYLAVYAAHRGMTLAGVGVLSAVSAAVSAALQPLIGRLVDRTGRRRLIMVVAIAAGAVGFAGLGFATVPVLIVLCAALIAAGFYSSRVVIIAATVNAVEHAGHGAAMYARFRILPSFGYTLTGLGGGLLLNSIGFASLFSVGAVLFLLAGLCGLALPAPATTHGAQARADERPLAPSLARRVLITLALMALLYYVANGSSDTYVPLLMRRLHGSFFDVGLVGTISAIAEIPLMILVGHLADRVQRATLLVLGMAVLPLRFALYFLVHTPGQLMGVQVLDGLSFSAYAIAGVALLTASIPREERAWALGVYSAAATLGPIAGPLLGGALAAGVGLQPMFGLFACGAIVVPIAVTLGLWPLLGRRQAV